MGFRKGAWATVWDVNPKTDLITSCRIAISRKNKQTGEYEQEFSGFVSFIGTGTAQKAASLKVKDRIKLDEVDVKTHYDAAKKTTYYNFNVYSFDTPEGNGSGGGNSLDRSITHVDDGELDEEWNDPF